jgi:hypothetical protein
MRMGMGERSGAPKWEKEAKKGAHLPLIWEKDVKKDRKEAKEWGGGFCVLEPHKAIPDYRFHITTLH